jgi:hypothetical protein
MTLRDFVVNVVGGIRAPVWVWWLVLLALSLPVGVVWHWNI